MKIIFLDFDGALNSSQYFGSEDYAIESDQMTDAEIMLVNLWLHFDPAKVRLINWLVDQTGAQVVVSSTWRLSGSVDELNRYLKMRGATFKITDKTPAFITGWGKPAPRYMEIGLFLDSLSKEPESFVILDDIDDMGKFQPYLVNTTYKHGLTPELTEQALSILNKKHSSGTSSETG